MLQSTARNASRYPAMVLLGMMMLAANAHAVTINWVPVGNPRNAGDPTNGTINGAVNYDYKIDKYDVTVGQYVEFLNAKDPAGVNTLGLWNSDMANAVYGGVSFTPGNASGSKYAPMPGALNHPINYVNWYDAIRFANWLNNGQGNGDTETGAYTILGGTPIPSNGLILTYPGTYNTITRNPDAKIVLPTNDEWYKAAYFNPSTNS